MRMTRTAMRRRWNGSSCDAFGCGATCRRRTRRRMKCRTLWRRRMRKRLKWSTVESGTTTSRGYACCPCHSSCSSDCDCGCADCLGCLSCCSGFCCGARSGRWSFCCGSCFDSCCG
jgi:hypothetical protein